MQFVASMLLIAIAAVVGRRRPFPLLVAGFLLWVVIPGLAVETVVGIGPGRIAIHPGSALLITTALVQFVTNVRGTRAVLLHRPDYTVLLLGVCFLALIQGLLGGLGIGAALAVVDLVLAPVAAYLLVGQELLAHPEKADWLRRILLAVAFGEAAFALIQALAHSPLVWLPQFEAQRRFSYAGTRHMGTFDHPLVLAFFLVVMIPLLAGVRRWWVTSGGLLLLIAGVLATQSRFGIAAASAGALYVVLRGRGSARGRLAGLAVLIGAAGYAVGQGLSSGVQDRFSSDSASTDARIRAIDYWFSHLGDFAWAGQGVGASFDVALSSGLETSFESSFLMWSVDIGLIPAVMLFGVLLFAGLGALRREAVPGAAVATLLALVAAQTFSAMATRCAAPIIVFIVASLAVHQPVKRRVRRVVAPPPPTRRSDDDVTRRVSSSPPR